MDDWYQNNSVSVISETVMNYTDPHIYFAWAAVLEASHGPTDSDNFTLMLTDHATHKVLYAVTYDSYDNGSIFDPYGNWFCTDWQVQDLDVNAMRGDTFALTLLGADCPYGGPCRLRVSRWLWRNNSTADHAGARHAGNGMGAVVAANWLCRRLT